MHHAAFLRQLKRPAQHNPLHQTLPPLSIILHQAIHRRFDVSQKAQASSDTRTTRSVAFPRQLKQPTSRDSLLTHAIAISQGLSISATGASRMPRHFAECPQYKIDCHQNCIHIQNIRMIDVLFPRTSRAQQSLLSQSSPHPEYTYHRYHISSIVQGTRVIAFAYFRHSEQNRK